MIAAPKARDHRSDPRSADFTVGMAARYQGRLRQGPSGLLLILAALLTACQFGSAPPPEAPKPPPPVCSAQHSWGHYHLPHNTLSPVVRNESSYTPDLVAWNLLGTPIQLRPSGAGFILEVTDGGDQDSGWLGLASITANAEGHIATAEVQMNRTILRRYEPAVAAHVLCQELGHLLGLDHQRGSRDSCLEDCHGLHGAEWIACLEDDAGTTPNAHDAQQLRAIYEHAVDNAPPKPPCVGQIEIHRLECPGGVCP